MGDEEGFLREALPAMDLVYNLARRTVPRKEDAEDLVQETYLNAFRAWQARRRPRKMEPWLATICLNLARSYYRRRSRRPLEVLLEGVLPVEAIEDVEDRAMSELQSDAVHRALWSLTEGQRVALALVDLSGLSVTEAARIMGTPKGTVLSRLHRGRKALAMQLRELVEEHEEEQP